MKLKKIEINNFRQFYLKHTLEFNTLSDKKVTLIRGQNGSGKTALLNAFWWCLYGEKTEKFKNSESLISLKAISKSQVGDDISCKVSIVFDHDGLEYIIERKQQGEVSAKFDVKDIINKAPKVIIRDKGGETRDHIGNPQQKIFQLLPRALASYFFFDGENLQHMTEKSKNLNIAEAIRLVMGITLLQRAANELTGNVYEKFKKLKKQYGTEKSKKISEELERLQSQKVQLEEKLKNEESEVEAIEKKISVYDKKLEANQKTQESQRQLEEIRQKVKSVDKDISENNKRKNKIISSRGYLAFIKNQIVDVEEIIEKSNKGGVIPKGYKNVFIEGLLKSKKCICGEKLDEGTEKFSKVSRLKKQGNCDDIDDKVAILNEKIKYYKNNEIESFKKDLDDYIGKEKELYVTLKYSKEQEDGILKNLKQEAAQIENEENLGELKLQLEKDKKRKREQIGKIKNQIEIKIYEIKKKEKDLEKSKDTDNRGILATQRMTLSKKLGELCKDFSEIRDKKILQELEKNVNNTFQKIAIKPFKITLTPSYEFQILNDFGVNTFEVGESTGESQMLSLAFIGNLLKLAKDLFHNKDKNPNIFPNFSGGIYPLVIDSPFGQIDDHYRPQIIKAAINLAPQIVLFVSGSQWDGAIDKEVRPYISTEYLIKYYKPKKEWTEKDNKDHVIEINGAKYNFLEKTDNDFESSELERI